jgi:uncharacterized OB-fold protein
MSRRQCDDCGRQIPPAINQCPDCGGEVRVTIDEPGHGRIEYLITRRPSTDPRRTP